MQSIRQRIDAFMGDEKARGQYDTLVTRARRFKRRTMSAPLSREEINEFESNAKLSSTTPSLATSSIPEELQTFKRPFTNT